MWLGGGYYVFCGVKKEIEHNFVILSHFVVFEFFKTRRKNILALTNQKYVLVIRFRLGLRDSNLNSSLLVRRIDNLI